MGSADGAVCTQLEMVASASFSTGGLQGAPEQVFCRANHWNSTFEVNVALAGAAGVKSNEVEVRLRTVYTWPVGVASRGSPVRMKVRPLLTVS